MKNLLDLLHEADAIQIDDYFIRYFGLDIDGTEGEDDIILHLEIETEYNLYEWFFTVKELETAEFIPETNEWVVYQPNEKEPYMITAYTVETLGAE